MNESAVIKTLEKQLAQSQRTNEKLQAQIEKNSVLITKLQNQLDVLLRTLYGKKSEKSSQKNTTPPNHGTGNETPGTDDTPPNRRHPQTSSEKKTSGRKPLPPDLPRIVVTHDIPASEKIRSCCGQERKRFSQCITEQLDFMPAHLVVKQHIRYKCHCPCCPQDIKTAPLPAQPIDKGLAGPSLLADILISKFQDALPLYRQKQRFKRHGLDIADSTLCDWVGPCAHQLKPLVTAMKADALTSKKLHVDDTPLPLLDRGKTKKGRLWIYLANGPQPPNA